MSDTWRNKIIDNVWGMVDEIMSNFPRDDDNTKNDLDEHYDLYFDYLPSIYAGLNLYFNSRNTDEPPTGEDDLYKLCRVPEGIDIPIPISRNRVRDLLDE